MSTRVAFVSLYALVPPSSLMLSPEIREGFGITNRVTSSVVVSIQNLGPLITPLSEHDNFGCKQLLPRYAASCESSYIVQVLAWVSVSTFC